MVGFCGAKIRFFAIKKRDSLKLSLRTGWGIRTPDFQDENLTSWAN